MPKASGTQAATIGTEHTLATITDAGIYVFVVDTATLAAGDRLELRIKTKCLTGGTSRVTYLQAYADAQPADDAMKNSVPIPSDIEAVFTLKQTAGTGRNFPWKVLDLKHDL